MLNNTTISKSLNNSLSFAVELNEYKPLIPRDYKMADYQYEVIMKRIKDFEDELDDEHEVSIQLASFGKDILMNVVNIGYSNPHTLVFHGFINGEKATLLQHLSMLSFLLLAAKKQEPDKPARRIGFSVENN